MPQGVEGDIPLNPLFFLDSYGFQDFIEEDSQLRGRHVIPALPGRGKGNSLGVCVILYFLCKLPIDQYGPVIFALGENSGKMTPWIPVNSSRGKSG